MDEPPKKPAHISGAQAYMRYAGLAMQMGLTIGLLTWLGLWLDGRYPGIAPAGAVIGSLGGVALSFYSLFKSLAQDKPS